VLEFVAAESVNVIVELVPTKFVSAVHVVRFVETRMCPFKPVDNSRLKTSPFVFSGTELLKVSCNMNVLLDTMLTLLVVEKIPPKFSAYAFTVLVPEVSSTVLVQFVQPFVVADVFQAALFN